MCKAYVSGIYYCPGDDTMHECPQYVHADTNMADKEYLYFGSYWGGPDMATLPTDCVCSPRMIDDRGKFYTECNYDGNRYVCKAPILWYTAANGLYLSNFYKTSAVRRR